jgi:hypothetical protein
MKLIPIFVSPSAEDAPNCYLVTGGAIKLTQRMKNVYLQHELRKLEQAKMFLLHYGIDYPGDLNTYKDE